MTFTFISRWKNYSLVLEPKKTREGEVVTDGQVAQFDNFSYRTEDEEIAKKIRKGPSFGADYWEYGQPLPATVKKMPDVTGIGAAEKMPAEKEGANALDAISERFKSIETMVMEVAKTVDSLAKIVSQAPAENKKAGKTAKKAGKKAAEEDEESDDKEAEE